MFVQLMYATLILTIGMYTYSQQVNKIIHIEALRKGICIKLKSLASALWFHIELGCILTETNHLIWDKEFFCTMTVTTENKKQKKRFFVSEEINNTYLDQPPYLALRVHRLLNRDRWKTQKMNKVKGLRKVKKFWWRKFYGKNKYVSARI